MGTEKGFARTLAAAVAVVLLCSGVADAQTTHCRIHAPARATYEQAVSISDLTATNLPKHRTLGGSPCATASWLAYTFEWFMVSGPIVNNPMGLPSTLETDDDELHRVRPLKWTMRYSIPITGCAEALTATFAHGHQLVSMRVRLLNVNCAS
jgi:hypothetical protein